MTTNTAPKTPQKAPKDNSSFSREGLLGIFYGAAMGTGTLAGLITFGVTHIKDIETQCGISLSTTAGAAGAAVATLGTAILFHMIRPKQEDYKTEKVFKSDTKEHKRRFAYAATGALLGLTEMGLIAGHTYMDGDIVYKMKPPYIAPPVIVQNNSNTDRSHYHTDNGFILSIA